MFFYSTSNKFRHKLNFHHLATTNNEAWLKQAACWAEEKWGYIRGFQGVSFRENLIRENFLNNFHIVSYQDIPIGMFALLEHKVMNMKAKELMYFYIDENFRGLGIGSRVMKEVKRLSKEANAILIVFDTLNPNLNHFYEKNGAKVICEHHLLGYPTTVMRI